MYDIEKKTGKGGAKKQGEVLHFSNFWVSAAKKQMKNTRKCPNGGLMIAKHHHSWRPYRFIHRAVHWSGT